MKKATFISECGLDLLRRRPTLPHSFPCSTIGPARLNFRVRDGNGCDPRGKITENLASRGRRLSLHDVATSQVWLGWCDGAIAPSRPDSRAKGPPAFPPKNQNSENLKIKEPEDEYLTTE